MKYGSLFSGIGGFNLAAECMGWKIIFNCEIDKFCQKVLKYYWPKAKLYEDIRKTNFTEWRGKIDVISAGVPCQPTSVAGKRNGEGDIRWLWPETIRAVREIKPPFVVCENPTGILSLGHGKPFASILSALENEGYSTELFIIPACGIQAPHKRDRVWIIAYASKFRCRTGSGEYNRIGERQICENKQKNGNKILGKFKNGNEGGITSNSNSNIGCEGRLHKTRSNKTESYFSSCNTWINQCQTWYNFPTQSPICGRDDGLSSKLDGITFPKWRNESIKALGNAVVPQIVFQIFKAIEQYEFDLLNKKQ